MLLAELLQQLEQENLLIMQSKVPGSSNASINVSIAVESNEISDEEEWHLQDGMVYASPDLLFFHAYCLQAHKMMFIVQ